MLRQHSCSSFASVLMRHLMLHDIFFVSFPGRHRLFIKCVCAPCHSCLDSYPADQRERDVAITSVPSMSFQFEFHPNGLLRHLRSIAWSAGSCNHTSSRSYQSSAICGVSLDGACHAFLHTFARSNADMLLTISLDKIVHVTCRAEHTV